jgi:maltooligosyltrehalose trehalohydrolase
LVSEHPWKRALGARPVDERHAEFRVWAPNARTVGLRLGGQEVTLEDAGDGVYEVVAPARAGDDYLFLLDGRALPDPCSRSQPEGLRGASHVVVPEQTGGLERTLSPQALVIYELHIGTFTESGTFAAAAPHMEELAELGIGAVEIMPVAEFPGRRGWGYDGVYLSAPQSSYGGPNGLLDLVGAAHRAGLAVILDVVYNHVGASGVKALEAFGPYFTDAYETPWGRAINFQCGPVREWVCQSAEHWIREFGIDGLRLDAIHAIEDPSREHIVAEVARRVHSVGGALVIGEVGLTDPQAHGGYACDAVWDDHFHHALHTVLTGERDGYYASFGRVGQIADAFSQRPARRYVVYAQNHDQVGNRAFGDRLPGAVRPLAAFCTLVSPFIALLFQGEEYGEEAPFQFFSDHIDEEIAQATREGRREEFAAFSQFEAEEIPDPQDPATFERSKLTRRRDPQTVALYRELISLRQDLDPGDPDEIAFDEESRWLRVRRGRFEILANFATAARSVPCEGSRLRLATGPDAALEARAVRLAPLSGAVVEGP